MKTRTKIIIAVLIALIIAAVCYYFYKQKKEAAKTTTPPTVKTPEIETKEAIKDAIIAVDQLTVVPKN
jgi:LPS O-antigen subunit length determinant protein (WzzB/FepE family)